MSKFRTNTYDSMSEPKKTKPVKPGTVPENKVPIFNHKGNMVGRCGLGMSSAGVARFTGTLDNRVVKRNGRNAWVGAAPKGPNKAARAQSAKLAKSHKADKGSNR